MKVRCLSCPWEGHNWELEASWPVTDTTRDQPYDICPCCGSGDLEDIEEEEDD